MQGVVGQDESFLLFRCKPVFNQREIKILIATVELVTDDRMPDMGEVNADLVFAAGLGQDAQD